MALKNKKCRNCGNEFHACDGCSLSFDWEFEYCSEHCKTTSSEYILANYLFEKIYKKMKNDSLHSDFMEFIDSIDKWKSELPKWVMKIEM